MTAEGDDVWEAIISSIVSGQDNQNENPDHFVDKTAEGDDVWEAIVSSIVSGQDNQNESLLSTDDLAWVDSCLVKETEPSDSDWNALKDALLDIISSSSEPTSSSNVKTAESNGFARGTCDDSVEMEIGEEDQTHVTGRTDNNLVPVSSEVETAKFLRDLSENSESDQTTENTDSGQLHDYLRNDWPNFSDKKEDTDSSSSFGLSIERDFSSENIFRVWDLETSIVEEDGVVKQLENALAENSLPDLPSTHDHGYSVPDTDEEKLENLVANMADLSLNSL